MIWDVFSLMWIIIASLYTFGSNVRGCLNSAFIVLPAFRLSVRGSLNSAFCVVTGFSVNDSCRGN